MRKMLLCCAFVLGTVPLAQAANVDVNVGVNIGGPVGVYVNPPVVIERPPLFLRPPNLGFYVAAGVGFDMFYLGNRYYLNNGNIWYASPYYNGPWVKVQYRAIPYQIRRHPLKRIHYYRDVQYRKYGYEKNRYKYKHFQPKFRDNRGKGDGRVDRDVRGNDGRGKVNAPGNDWKENRGGNGQGGGGGHGGGDGHGGGRK